VREASRFQRLRGHREPPVTPREVRAGSLTAELDGPDLRYIRLGELELVRRIYAAIRDSSWQTLPPVLSNVELDVRDESFLLAFDARNVGRGSQVDIRWHGELRGDSDGTIACEFEGMVEADFEYCRIGWCVLHPAENAGQPYRALTPSGGIQGTLPDTIGPQRVIDGLPAPLFPSFSEVEIDVAPGVRARFEFDGDLFEMEDQRNWTDASFKTYSTPLSLGFPRRAKAGQRIRQSVRLILADTPHDRRTPTTSANHIDITLGAPLGRALPAFGLGATPGGVRLRPGEIDLLRGLAPGHLRADVRLNRPDWRDAIGRDLAAAGAIGACLEIAAFLPVEGAPEELDGLADVLEPHQPRVARVLVFRPGEPTTDAATVAIARAHLGRACGGARFIGGTDVLFMVLNRQRPELSGLDGVAWPLHATTHADDDTSVVETASMHGETVRSARAFCADLPLIVTPVTIGERPQADPRQPSLLGAVWALTSAKHLAEAGADSVTYFESAGCRGVVESMQECRDADTLRLPTVFPLYHVLADLCELEGAELVEAVSSRPMVTAGLAVRRNGRLHVLIANLSCNAKRCRVFGLPLGRVGIRRLDEGSFPQATSDPERFRAECERLVIRQKPLDLHLAAYALVRIDVIP
jgi:hypothetical protein